jgi:hypothetical protein
MFGLLPGRVTYVTDKNGVVQMILIVCWLQNIFPKRWKLLKISVIYSKNLLEGYSDGFNLCLVFWSFIDFCKKRESIFENNMVFYILQTK